LAKRDKSAEQEEKDKKRREQIAQLHRTRLGHLKRAQTAVRDEKIAIAVEAYNKYLGILALYFETTEDKLSPKFFDAEKEVSELLLVSIAYWDLAKAYDRNPNLQRDCQRCLDQFVKFSMGYKYQHVNAQIVRKFNNKKQAHNPKAFETAYQRLQISTKRCYIASSCFGEDDYKTNILRSFKYKIAPYELGRDFIDFYYQVSPSLIYFLNRHKKLQFCFNNFLARPILFIFVLILRQHVSDQNTHS
jgi:hypothetical protein